MILDIINPSEDWKDLPRHSLINLQGALFETGTFTSSNGAKLRPGKQYRPWQDHVSKSALDYAWGVRRVLIKVLLDTMIVLALKLVYTLDQWGVRFHKFGCAEMSLF